MTGVIIWIGMVLFWIGWCWYFERFDRHHYWRHEPRSKK